MTWKDIEKQYWEKVNEMEIEFDKDSENIKEFGYKIQIGDEIFRVTDYKNIEKFFKSQFKQAMEEIVGDKVECTKEEWAHHKNRWQQEEHNKFRQEILDKLNKFFE